MGMKMDIYVLSLYGVEEIYRCVCVYVGMSVPPVHVHYGSSYMVCGLPAL